MLNRFLPTPRLSEKAELELPFGPHIAYQRLVVFDFAHSHLLRALVDAHVLSPRKSSTPLRIDALPSDGPSVCVLARQPGEWLVLGVIGRLWPPRVLIPISEATFAGFSQPGFIKLLLSVHFVPTESGCRLEVELRLSATDDGAWHAMRKHYWAIGPLAHLLRMHLVSILADELGADWHAGSPTAAAS